MKVPVSWLREFVAFEVSPKDLAERLTLAGIEVERIEELGHELAGVVVGEIVAVEPHPQADRLVVCTVRTSGSQSQRVVCGAPNARPGLRVPYATPGARLPDGRRIEVVDLRGVRSAGMLCSEVELGLGEDGSGLLELAADASPGTPLAAHLGIEDTVLEVAITPNRGDCLSVLGLAREIAALYGLKLHRPRIRLREQGEPASARITVAIEDADACARYSARYIEGVRLAASPTWMQRRLLAAGLRPINNIVDVTNYVMLERGQPLHAFDYDRLPAPRIVVRRAGTTGSIRTLDERDRTLEPGDLLITTGAEPVAIAGVMGGANSEVAPQTRNILLESAWFDPSTVRATGRRLGLRSEASYRFERGVDVEGVLPALDRAAALIAELSGGRIARGVVEAYPSPRRPVVIDLRVPRVEFLLGLPVSRSEAAATLHRLGAKVRAKSPRVLSVEPPSFRHDLEREIDLVEEIIRLLGYGQVPTTLPTTEMQGGARPAQSDWERDLRQFLAAQGFHEMVMWSFATARSNDLFRGIGVPTTEPVRIRNPVVTEDAELRFSLCPGLVQAVRTNLNFGESSVAAFAVGKVFWMADRPAEGHRLAAVLSGAPPEIDLSGKQRSLDFLDVKGALESVLARLRVLDRVRWERPGEGQMTFHPGKSALAVVDGHPVAVVGALHPESESELGLEQPCWLFELDLDGVLEYVSDRPIFTDLPRFPVVVRDVAVVTEADFPSDQVVRFVRGWNRQVVDRVELFDEYTGAPIPEGKKSLAYSIAYRAADRTLTDDEVNRLHQALLADLRAALPVELR